MIKTPNKVCIRLSAFLSRCGWVSTRQKASSFMYRQIIFIFALLLVPLAVATGQEPTLESVIAQYQDHVRANDPEASARASDAKPSRWNDVTQPAIATRAADAKAILDQLDAVPGGAEGPEAAILRHLLQRDIDAHRFDTARIPLVGDWGFFAEPHFAARSVRLSNRADAEAWIDRLNDVPRYFAENIVNMRRGMATGWTAHADPLATSMDQVREQIVTDITTSALYEPFLNLPEDMDLNQKALLQARGRVAVSNAVAAYRNLLFFLETEYAPNAREMPGIAGLPQGLASYDAALADHTAGAGYTAEQIHALGLSEVARIRTEMETIISETGFDGGFAEFVDFLRTDPQFYATSAEDLIEKASEMSKRLDAILPRYFGKLPRLTYGVEPVPAAIAPGYTTGRYAGGDMKTGHAATYWVNTYRLNQRPLYQLPALSAHEAVPGHHLQIALAQELEDVPDFRRNYYATAFGEGWGLYAEKLAGEAGIYRTPYERFGQLSYEMWRACRLVADTGLHHYGWTRDQAEACFYENTALAPLNIQTEVTRYIGWPGQATAYKIGELKILDLRERAKAALGQDFDIRGFHDHLLGAGSMPLDSLEQRMDAWIDRQLAASGTGSNE